MNKCIFIQISCTIQEPGQNISTVARFAGWTTKEICPDSQHAQDNILVSKVSRPTLGSIQIPIQWVTGLFLQRYSSQGIKLTIHLHIQLRLRKHAVSAPLPLHGMQRNNFTFLRICCHLEMLRFWYLIQTGFPEFFHFTFTSRWWSFTLLLHSFFTTN